ncbi:MAG: methyltransferase family protein [Terriglobia bacterium]
MVKTYLVIFAGLGLVTALVADPSQDRERRKPGPAEINASSRLIASFLFFATVLVAALDASRFHWVERVRGATQIAALAVLILAAGLQVWAMITNPFFSSAIRIQAELGHELIARGPYRFIRHPGYLAMTIIMPATALAIGSLTATLPALCYSVLILSRARSEDEFLAVRLAGYAEYAARVRYRLIPTLW